MVEIRQSEALDEHAKAAAELKLAAQIDPVCGAAVAFQAQKGQEIHDALDRDRREVARTARTSLTPSAFRPRRVILLGGYLLLCYSGRRWFQLP